MKLLAALVCLLSGNVLIGVSQSLPDTLLLQEVTIMGKDPAKYLPGGRQEVIDTDSVSLQNLTGLLEYQIPVYFIQYGAPGQLSSINLRGLGASRTSVQWQGMEINSFTLGQTDFGELAAGNGDRISVQFGGVGPVFGNSALGGTVMLQDHLLYNRGHGVSMNAASGSYGSLGIGLNYRYGAKKWASSTRLYRRQADNYFKYQLAGESRRQQNAAFLHYGISQDLKYRFNSSHQLSLHFWYNDHFREIQPNKSDFTSDEKLDTENTRMALKWQWLAGNWYGQVQTGYTNDDQLYDKSERIRLGRWYGSFEAEWKGMNHLDLRFGGNLNYLIPEVDAYQENIKETRSELYASAIWSRIRDLQLGLNFRTPMVNGDLKTLTPLFSAQYRIYENKKLAWSANFQYGQSYRLPTMNDLYWYPGGNTSLRPEISRNMEIGMELAVRKSTLIWELSAQGFRHHVDDWIIWIPGGREEAPGGTVTSFWYPENIREVLAFGVQYQNRIDWQLPVEHLTTILSLDGTFNRSLNQNSLSAVDRSKDKQLPYTPVHVINGHWTWKYRTWHIGATALYRSKRYVEANNELPPLDAYTLWNFAVGKRGSLGAVDWSLQLAINNAMEEEYETYENRAMPGRNYQLNMIFKYNQ